MLGLLVLESANLWPLAAAAGALLLLAVLWLYPSQVRQVGIAGWLAVLLRCLAAAALTVSLLKPVILQPKTAEQWGAVVVLLDRSRSMSVVDSGRTPAERVALAGALGRLAPGARTSTGAALANEIDGLESFAQDVLSAHSDLDYAKLSGRGIPDRQMRLAEVAARYTESARALAVRSLSAPENSELRQRLKDLENVPAPEARDAWATDVKDRLAKARIAARKFQDSADEALYQSDASVRATCDQLAKLSRLALVEEAILRPQSGLAARLAGNMPVLGLWMDRGLTPVTLTENGRPVAPPQVAADINQSDLAGAVTTVINGLSGRPVRSVVLFSDGRQVGGRGDITSALRPSGIPVFTVGVAPEQTPDVSIVDVSLSTLSVFAGESIEGEVEVRHWGAVKAPAEVHVSTSAGEVVERLKPLARAGRRSSGHELVARFEAPINAAGGQELAGRIAFSIPSVPGEVTDENNQVERWIKISSDKLKVTICTAAPTWDFQYVRGALSRRPWVTLESQVLDPHGPRLGLSPAQILNQDVVILSDVPVDALDVNQWDALGRLVNERGGSLILVAGTSYPIADYAAQPIARTFLPFRDVRPTWKEWPGEQPAFHFIPTAQGEQEALRIAQGGEAAARRWQELPGLYRYLQIADRNLVPGAQKLLLESGSGAPVLTEQRLGAGRVFLLGLNETWRWRLKSGERDADQFWRQLVRYAAGEPYAANDGPLALDADKASIEPGEAVHVRARVRDAKFPPADARSCALEILRDGKRFSSRLLQGNGGGHFTAYLRDLPEGRYQLQLRGVSPEGSALAVRVPLRVAANAEAEMRDVSGDPGVLTKIAKSSGGQYQPIEQVDQLPDRLNALRRTESQFTRRPLWNSPFLFAFVLACFGGEWALRKRFGLA